MNDWFTVETIDPQTYAISEYGHPEETHCYLLCGRERAALVDTGLGVSDIRKTLESLTDLPVTVFTTHVHWDHIGGHRLFESVAVHEAEKEWLSGRFPLSQDEVRQNLTKSPCAFPEGFDVGAYRVYPAEPTIILRDGDRYDLGDRVLQVVHTPGHSPGHCCYYEAERGYLYTGDLVYRGTLYAYYPSTDPALFYHSVKRLQGFKISKLLPGHHMLQIPVATVDEIAEAFASLEAAGRLRQGAGLFRFNSIQLKI